MQVVLVVNVGVQLRCGKLWHSTAQDERVLRESNGLCAFELGQIERQEFEQGASPGERLRDGFPQARLMRSCQNELSVRVSFFIDECLYCRCKLGHALDFVHDDGGWVEREETTVIVFGKFSCLGIFEIDIGMPGEAGFGYRCLAGLPWADNREHGEFSSPLADYAGNFALNHIKGLPFFFGCDNYSTRFVLFASVSCK